MLALEQYFNGLEHSIEQTKNATLLINRVGVMLSEAEKAGVKVPVNKRTKSIIAGDGNGGFRLESCQVGAKDSAHKQGMAVDLYDPFGDLDGWLDDIKLFKFDLYREAPGSTGTWCHLQTRKTKSGKRTFFP